MKVAIATAISPVKNNSLTVIPIFHRKNKGFLLVSISKKFNSIAVEFFGC